MVNLEFTCAVSAKSVWTKKKKLMQVYETFKEISWPGIFFNVCLHKYVPAPFVNNTA